MDHGHIQSYSPIRHAYGKYYISHASEDWEHCHMLPSLLRYGYPATLPRPRRLGVHVTLFWPMAKQGVDMELMDHECS